MINLTESVAAWNTDSFKETVEREFMPYIHEMPGKYMTLPGSPPKPFEGDFSNLPFQIELDDAWEQGSNHIVVRFKIDFDTSSLDGVDKIICNPAGMIIKKTGEFTFSI